MGTWVCGAEAVTVVARAMAEGMELLSLLTGEAAWPCDWMLFCHTMWKS